MVNDVLERLSWNLPVSVQNEAIKQILNTENFDWFSLILPYGKKDSWENCAIILSQLSNDIIESVIADLMRWFQDANWPGTDIIAK